MQLGKKSKTTDMFERVRGDLGVEAEESAPSVPAVQTLAALQKTTSARPSIDREAIYVVISEKISAKISREGTLQSFSVKGDLQLKITDSSLTKVKLDLLANPSYGAQFRPHPNVDRSIFNSSQAIQLKDPSRGFPTNKSTEILRWNASPGPDGAGVLPITFTVWINKDSGSITVEYELTGDDSLSDVIVLIPYATSEPAVASFDAIYEVSGDSLEWKIGPVDESNSNGSFEFEVQTDDESEFFPMKISFAKSKPLIDVDVSSVSLIDMSEEMAFTKEVRSIADAYTVE